ncbi:Ribosomal RNA large subunit methyltransferase J [Aquimixticola soesokkakensis]|uniref:Ribosomal RNA large subunit methyltransferase J n=1 Tax=Aquimixticola soesokkakensis TaxID=1519096 RepID=A0A1Y5SFG3_9RHOB|nr:23S rRNA (adenine(2030)-N(6))-methyltransferase RlmJ [Aquimixticola soesokkakensis]SLN39604.1 Ribosomal RNA large subunit methyltransferase J [Aquimixticola soesokkakensis]
MLSYQHIFHAGNLADVQKHAVLATALDYLTQKPKPLTYIETHAGRGLYHLDAAEALKTGEAAQGIERFAHWFQPDHPYARAIAQVQRGFGQSAYPGSPAVAASLLRPEDRMQLAELHPQEHAALERNLAGNPLGDMPKVTTHKRDGFEMAQAICPPDPRRGLMLIDPSYEIKTDYDTIPKTIQQLHRKWNVGVILLWYPILTSGAHHAMLGALEAANLPDTTRFEVAFPPARKGHGMVGSGLFMVNTPYGLSGEIARLTKLFKTLA